MLIATYKLYGQKYSKEMVKKSKGLRIFTSPMSTFIFLYCSWLRRLNLKIKYSKLLMNRSRETYI